MLFRKVVAEVLRTTEKEIRRATMALGNVGTMTAREGPMYSSDDIDRIKEYLETHPSGRRINR